MVDVVNGASLHAEVAVAFFVVSQSRKCQRFGSKSNLCETLPLTSLFVSTITMISFKPVRLHRSETECLGYQKELTEPGL